MKAIQQTLRNFVTENFLFGQGGDSFSNQDSFLESGIIDSTGVLELVTFLESEYKVSIADDELVPDNLDSIDRLLAFIERKLGDAQKCA
ncbi:MAG: acyl carrier protein [Planctomycetales bacterium]|nr:acyl carrier protein [Planctomycetales bacterium]